jgi:hypothetical protein
VVWKPDYATLPEGKAFLRIGDTVDDVEIALWITAASRGIDASCNRQFGQEAAPVARTYERAPLLNYATGLWELEIDDVQDTTAMTVNGVALASSGATLLPRNAATDGRPYTRIGFTIWPIISYPGMPITNVMVARWGWTAFPAEVKAGVRLQINRWAFRREAPQGVAGSPDVGSEIRMQAKLDPDVIKMLGPVRRRRRAG